MANTLNVNRVFWDGTRGMLHYNLTADGATPLADDVLVDISTLGAAGAAAPTSVKIRSVQATLYGDFILRLEMEAGTDQPFYLLEGQTADVSFSDYTDFTDFPGAGWIGAPSAANFVGDISATTTNMAASDGFDLVVIFQRSS